MNASRASRETAAVINAVTTQLGHRPRSSLYLVPLIDTGANALLRVDLPPLDDAGSSDDRREYADRILGMVTRIERVTAVAGVLFSGEPGPTEARPALVGEIAAVARRAGIAPLVFGYLAADCWGEIELGGITTVARRPLDELGPAGLLAPSNTPIGLWETNLRGPVVDRHAERFATDDDLEARLDSLLAADRVRVHPDDLETVAVVCAVRCSMPGGAEELLAHIAFGPDAEVEVDDSWRVLFDDGSPIDGRVDRLRSAFEVERCARAMPVLELAAALATDHVRADACAAVGWLAWALGLGSLAEMWCGAALESVPAPALAETVDALTGAGVVAPWFGKAPVSVDEAA